MAVLSRAPRDKRLVGLVDRVWWAAPEPTADVRIEWVLPTCRAQMILSPEGSVFAGPKVAAEQIERRTGGPMVGASLAAGAVSALLGIGGYETLGATVRLDSVWEFGSLSERLAEQATTAALDLIEAALVDQLQPARVDELVLAAAQLIRAGRSATQAVAMVGADRRTFVPEFRRTVGVAPKRYERVCRFNRTIEAIRGPDAAPLAMIAAEHGYADQAHLSREIRHFALASPSRLHRDGSPMVNHVSPDKIFKT
jgi:AraC-like DNA-binding protein